MASSTANNQLPLSLLQLLSNSLVLYQTAPYLPISSLLALGATSKAFKSIIHSTPDAFRRLDLTRVKAAQFQIAGIDHGGEVWRNVQMDENVTEEDFYGGPLQGIFNRLRKQHMLQHVQTMILDGLSVTSDMVCEIILNESFNVRILSIREVQNLNERKLQQSLLYAIRPSRPENTPKLQGLYIFGARDSAPPSRYRRHVSSLSDSGAENNVSSGGIHSQGAQIGAEWNVKSANSLADGMQNGDAWYQGTGKLFTRPPSMEWAGTMRACEGIISFDAVLCKGPRHSMHFVESDQSSTSVWYEQPGAFLPIQSVTFAMGGCAGCGSAPERPARFGVSSLERFPLLAPPPLHSSTSKGAKMPFSGFPERQFFARCTDCLRNRHCESCHKWWCEDCYEVPNHTAYGGSMTLDGQSDKKVKKECFECGNNCDNCLGDHGLTCRVCRGGYCRVHNEGSTLTNGVQAAVDGHASYGEYLRNQLSAHEGIRTHSTQINLISALRRHREVRHRKALEEALAQPIRLDSFRAQTMCRHFEYKDHIFPRKSSQSQRTPSAGSVAYSSE